MSQDINTGVFSEVLNGKADIDLRNIDTNKCDMVIEYQEPTAANNYTWYRLYATGWVEQGGITPKNVSSYTVNLPITMEDTNYNVFCTQHRLGTGTGGFERTPGVGNLSTTTVYIDMNAHSDENVYWKVSGLADMTTHEILPNPTSNTARALVIQVLEGMYPVGSLYMGTQATCPMSVFFGTWELVSNGKALWTGDGTNANTTIAAGLPNITGAWTSQYNISLDNNSNCKGAIASTYSTGTGYYGGTSAAADWGYGFNFDASKSSSIYGKSSTVQPPAYVVNVWRRTA